VLSWGHLDHRNRREAISGGRKTVVEGGGHVRSLKVQRRRGEGGYGFGGCGVWFRTYIRGEVIDPGRWMRWDRWPGSFVKGETVPFD